MHNVIKNRKAGLFPLVWLTALLFLPGIGSAEAAEPCTPLSPGGSVCELNVAQVRPTQFAVGMQAVRCKQAKIEKKSKKKLVKWLQKKRRRVPAVIGPDGRFYITDRHHMATALYRARPSLDKTWNVDDKRLMLRIDYNLHAIDEAARLTMDQFWDNMSGTRYPNAMNDGVRRVWLYDEKGMHPMDPYLLPDNLGEMLNDIYRTLSRWVRKTCGYLKAGDQQCAFVHPMGPPPLYLEFVWANYLRQAVRFRTRPLPVCRAMPYSTLCLPDQAAALRRVYRSAMQAVTSPRAKAFLGQNGLDPTTFGYNDSGKVLELRKEYSGCPSFED